MSSTRTERAGVRLTPARDARSRGRFAATLGSTIRRPRDPDWVKFRKRVIAALERDGAFFYISADRIAGRCPICEEPLGVRFKGRTPAADLVCHGGCDERRLAATLGKAPRK